MLRILAWLVFMLSFITLKAQQSTIAREESTPYYQRYRLNVSEQQVQRLNPSMHFTSIAFTLADEASFTEFYCIVGKDTLKIAPAVHQPKDVKGVVSDLLVFDHPQAAFSILGRVEGFVWVHLMFAPAIKEEESAQGQRLMAVPCEEPEAVSQSVWREGLPSPQYKRDFNEVEHLIVHHSATSNAARDFTNVVRNIYLYHTQTNGWSDIGYNYLIAPDGTLFAGRDPGQGEQDKVRGAHFCGKNSETMGICLLGDFTAAEPTLAAMQRLEHLLSWKALKEALNPLANSWHPANPQLPVIAGHRDGCATACPGEHVYEKIPELRLAVEANLLACNQEPEKPGSEVWVYFAPKQQEVCLAGIPEKEREPIHLFNVQGKEIRGAIRQLESQDFCFKMEKLAPGIYFLQTTRGKTLIRKKFMVF